MPLSMSAQRGCRIGSPPPSVFTTHSSSVPIVVVTSYSQVRTLRPPAALFVTVTRSFHSSAKCLPQPLGHGVFPLATVESPASQMVIGSSADVPPVPPAELLPPELPPEPVPPLAAPPLAAPPLACPPL